MCFRIPLEATYRSNMINSKKQGFTLVELSIAIIIIGFLIAGISAGHSLIKQATLNSIITDQQAYLTALVAFKGKYGYYPGDFPNAHAFWPATSNGNGDGIIVFGPESFRAWQQLSLAGMIAGIYNGTSQEPSTRYSDVTLWRIESNACKAYTVPSNTKNTLQFQTNTWPPASVITAIEASQIDNKIDDGKPSDGRVYAIDENQTGAILEADGVTNAISLDCNGPNYNSTEAKYNLSYTPLGISRIYFYLPE